MSGGLWPSTRVRDITDLGMFSQDLIVLEMVLQQFGLGICIDGDEELEAAGGCHSQGWTSDQLMDVLVAAVVGQQQGHSLPSPEL